MSAEQEEIAAGAKAWSRIKDNGRKSWADWLAVGNALTIGRSSALKTANRNDAVGTRYNRAMTAWLKGNGLAGINAQERYRVLLIIENLHQISHWRDSLPEHQRRKLNHPNGVWARWQRSIREQSPAPLLVKQTATRPAPGRYGKAIFWPQDAVRRAAEKMLKSRSSDFMVLARCALEGAVRDEHDLATLVPPDHPAPAKRQASAAPVADQAAA
jgi:hypothetical protein